MIRSVVRISLAFRVLVLAIAAGLVAIGVLQLPSARVDALPEFGPPQVDVQTEALGLSAAEVEALITVPLEADLLNGVAWLDEIRSESVPGLSSIELVFEPGTDVLEARQMVAERMTQAHALPHVSRPPAMLQPLSSTSRVLMVGLSSDELSLMDLSVLARWKLKPRLTGVPGVANVAIWGQRERQLQVQVDPERLQENGVSVVQVMKTTGNALWVSPLSFVEASTPGSGGFIETPNQRMGVQHLSPISTAEDLAQVTVEDTEGRILRLGDVADVVENNQPLIGDAVVEDGPSLMLVIEKFPGESTVDVTEGLEAALAAMAPGLPGVTIDSSLYRPATTVETAMDRLGLALLIGFGLLTLLLGLFFFDWRATVVAAVAIGMSVLAAALTLALRDVTFNVMTAAGLVLVLALVVDDAVSTVHHIRRRLLEHRQAGTDRTSASIVTEATFDVRWPSLFATLVVVVAATPLLFLDELTGAFARPLLLSYGLALLASTVVGMTLTPVLAAVLLGSARSTRAEAPVVRWLRDRYERGFARGVRQPLPSLALVGLAAVGAAVMVPLLGSPALVPTLTDRAVLIQWDGAPGTSEPEMARITAAATSEFRALPGVQDVGAHVGRAITADQVVGVNSSDLWVSIAPDADYDDTMSAIHEVVDGYPGLLREVQTYPEAQIRRAQTGTDDDLVVRIYGPDAEVLGELADEVRDVVASVDSVTSPRIDVLPEEPTVQIQVDLDAAAAEGIKPGDVRRGATTYVSGVLVGSLFEDQKVFEVVVWGTPDTRHSMDSVSDLMIDKPGGGQVRLGDVASVTVEGSPNVILRDSVSRRVDVLADVDGAGIGPVAADVRAALASVDMPLEYHAEVLDEAQSADVLRTASLAVAAALGVFLLLQLGLNSWRLAAVLLVSMPVALLGGLLAALLDRGPLTLAALVGLLTVLGIAARTSLVSVRHFDRLRAQPGAGADDAVVQRGAGDRLAPIVVTALATAVLLVPVIVLGDVPVLEVIRPGAIVVLAGLVTTTLFALVVVPALYLRFGLRGREPDDDPYGEPTGPDGRQGAWRAEDEPRQPRGGSHAAV